MTQQPPQTLAQQAKTAYQRGEYLSAAQLFLQAAQGFTQTNAPLDAAEMQNNASVAFLQAGDAEKSLQALADSEAVFAAANDLQRYALAIGNRASALDTLNRIQEAEQAYQQAADLLQQIGDHASRLHLMQAYSAMQLRTGKQLQALATMHAGLENAPKLSLQQRFLKKLLQIPMNMVAKTKKTE